MTSTATSNTNNDNSFMVGTNTVIVLNTQHSLKLTNTNYPAWHVQMNALFIGYDLSGFIDGTKPCPAATDPNFNYWTRQDQLILHAIIIYVDPSIITALGTVKISQQAWEALKKCLLAKHVLESCTSRSDFLASTKESVRFLYTFKVLRLLQMSWRSSTHRWMM
ncbi:hypothetical protein TSUD_404160 [Trifolium subterraneum]|uniref:Retrotransposon Copia-like N-terminal domain-containing protein n=1 Tax=Trifolium subterraneum TaxID=3900 RepID=A0A2Z6NUE5_TRISU|nr:hypothetical protein TSUD_404160 [Trifolium subterraneum]